MSGHPTATAATLAASLRVATADVHEALDAEVEGGEWFRSRATYADLLCRLGGAHRSLEPGLAVVADGSGHEPRSPRAVDDLVALGEEPVLSTLAPPSFTSTSAWLGALYVVEGSSLGGRVLERWAAEALGDDVPRSFLHGHGPETGVRWRRTRDRLDRHDGDHAPVIDGAVATFSWFRQVLTR